MVLGKEGTPASLDLEATEMAIRTSMHKVGGVLLEKLLDRDSGHRPPRGGFALAKGSHAARGTRPCLSTIAARRWRPSCPRFM